MMSADGVIDYLNAKLADEAADGARRIGDSVMKDVSAFNARGVLNSSMRPRKVQQTLQDGYSFELQKMAKVLISLGIERDADAVGAFRQAAGRLADSLLSSFRRYAEYSSITVPSDLFSKVADRVIADVQRKLIGSERYEADKTVPAISIQSDQAAVAINSPGASVQASGRDMHTNTRVFDPAATLAALAALQKVIEDASVSSEAKRSLAAATEVLQVEAEVQKPDPSSLRQAYDWLRVKADKATDAAISAAVGVVGRSLFG